MKKGDLEKYLHQINPELFSFSFAMVPDRLQAQQIVLDSIYLLLLEEKELIGKVSSVEYSEVEKIYFEKVRKFLYGQIFKIGKKRFFQVGIGLKAEGKYDPFYKLTFNEKAILYLKQKMNFDFEELEEILGLTNVAIMTQLNSGRYNLMKKLGMEFVL